MFTFLLCFIAGALFAVYGWPKVRAYLFPRINWLLTKLGISYQLPL